MHAKSILHQLTPQKLCQMTCTNYLRQNSLHQSLCTLIFTYTEKNTTGCNSGKWKKVQNNILKEQSLVLKQTIPQQKALDLSFILTP